MGQINGILRNKTYAEKKYYKEGTKSGKRAVEPKKRVKGKNCCQRFKDRFERGQKRSKKRREQDVGTGDEEMGLLGTEEQKDESPDMTADRRIEEKVRWKYDMGSKWRNIQSVLGSSVLHWFIPMDWPGQELYARLQDGDHAFDLCPFDLNTARRACSRPN